MGGLLVPTYKDASGNDGKLVRLRDIDEGDQLVDSVPTYATANVTHNATTHVLTLTLTPTNIPSIAEFYFFTPATLPRNDEDLSMDINGNGNTRYAVYLPTGERAKINHIHPGALYIALRTNEPTTKRYTLTEFLGPRPQDYAIRFAISTDTDLVLSEISAGVATTLTSNQITLPAIPGEPLERDNYFFFGVPDNTGDINSIFQVGGFENIGIFQRVPGTIDDADGTAYKWWRSNTQQINGIGGTMWDIGQVLP